jgi:hypothetical protein
LLLYGCQSELLPNPDAYCVEKLIKTGTAAGSIYFKEFTYKYPGNTACSSIPFQPTGTGRSLLSKEDMGGYPHSRPYVSGYNQNGQLINDLPNTTIIGNITQYIANIHDQFVNGYYTYYYSNYVNYGWHQSIPPVQYLPMTKLFGISDQNTNTMYSF